MVKHASAQRMHFLPCSRGSVAPSPATVLFCTGFSPACCPTPPLASATAEDELEEDDTTAVAEEEGGGCLEIPPVAAPTPLWLVVAVCLDGLRWLPAAGLLE